MSTLLLAALVGVAFCQTQEAFQVPLVHPEQHPEYDPCRTGAALYTRTVTGVTYIDSYHSTKPFNAPTAFPGATPITSSTVRPGATYVQWRTVRPTPFFVPCVDRNGGYWTVQYERRKICEVTSFNPFLLYVPPGGTKPPPAVQPPHVAICVDKPLPPPQGPPEPLVPWDPVPVTTTTPVTTTPVTTTTPITTTPATNTTMPVTTTPITVTTTPVTTTPITVTTTPVTTTPVTTTTTPVTTTAKLPPCDPSECPPCPPVQTVYIRVQDGAGSGSPEILHTCRATQVIKDWTQDDFYYSNARGVDPNSLRWTRQYTPVLLTVVDIGPDADQFEIKAAGKLIGMTARFNPSRDIGDCNGKEDACVAASARSGLFIIPAGVSIAKLQTVSPPPASGATFTGYKYKVEKWEC
ncbi:uncharacterized protein EI90DRAFT_3015892 [Cantharellus anzutake]|uniref:uncharacterized protein n=1 Tax=Cantharellus anzutake TaxID=1750568 RepID=UPI001905E6CE|nr:uncharacterized protein EI90DRAFT_3015892 [Cantharellus anzutake]KAF8332281.1 hypothetical protein EI90DRAFT_3015892 [Cantharellus anzutake]